jgi:Co/Zn/Cd efflux system component
LKLDASILSTVPYDQEVESTIQSNERRMLWYVLLINFSFFLIEMVAGLIANSMGVVADSLDMLADSVVYGLALLAVGGTIKLKKNIAKSAGVFQIILAMIGFIEVFRRFIGIEKMPDFYTMIIVSVFALIANIICLYLLQMSKSKEAHMQASMIFTSNDIIINVGVIVAAIFVNIFNSSYPDLLIGAIVFVLVARGAYRIMQLAK